MILVVRRLFNLLVNLLYSTPGGLLATPSGTSVVLSWTYPTGTSPRSAQAIVLTDSAGTAISTTDAGSGTSTTLTGLTVSTAYRVAVRASYTGQPDSTGAFVTFTTSATAAPAATVPGAPTGVTATAGDGSATVSWTAPASDGGSAITSFQVRTTVGSTVTTASTASTATTFTVAGLTNGTACTFAVQAVNAVGSSAFSAESSAVIPVAAAPPVASQVSVASNGGAAETSITPSCGQAFTVNVNIRVADIAIQAAPGVLFPAGTVLGLADSSYVPQSATATGPSTASLGSATGASTVAGDFLQVTLNNPVDLVAGTTYYVYVFVPNDPQKPAAANHVPATLSGSLASLGPIHYSDYNFGGPPAIQASYYVPFKLYAAPPVPVGPAQSSISGPLVALSSFQNACLAQAFHLSTPMTVTQIASNYLTKTTTGVPVSFDIGIATSLGATPNDAVYAVSGAGVCRVTATTQTASVVIDVPRVTLPIGSYWVVLRGPAGASGEYHFTRAPVYAGAIDIADAMLHDSDDPAATWNALASCYLPVGLQH